MSQADTSGRCSKVHVHKSLCVEERRKPYGMCCHETGTEGPERPLIHERSTRKHVTTVQEMSHQKSLLTAEWLCNFPSFWMFDYGEYLITKRKLHILPAKYKESLLLFLSFPVPVPWPLSTLTSSHPMVFHSALSQHPLLGSYLSSGLYW